MSRYMKFKNKHKPEFKKNCTRTWTRSDIGGVRSQSHSGNYDYVKDYRACRSAACDRLADAFIFEA